MTITYKQVWLSTKFVELPLHTYTEDTYEKKGKKKVQGVPQSQTAVLPRHQEENALLQLASFTLGPDATLNTEIHKNWVRIKAPNSVNASKQKHKNQINHNDKKDEYLWLILLYVRVNENQ